jgi:hypothetical protein
MINKSSFFEENRKFGVVLMIFCCNSIQSIAQSEKYVGRWINSTINRQLEIATLVEGEMVNIKDLIETDTLAIDDYKGYFENGKIILPSDSIEHIAPYCEIKYKNDSLFYSCQGLFNKKEITTDTFVRYYEHDYKYQEKYLKRINQRFLSNVYDPFFTKRHISFNCGNCEAIRMTLQFDLSSSGQIKNNYIEITSETIYCKKLKPADINKMKQLFLDYYRKQTYNKELIDHRLKIEIRPTRLLKC